MDEYFWFLADEPSDRRVRDAMRRAESAPQSESMRPSQRTRTPSADRKKRMRRSAAGHLDATNWDEVHPHLEDIHRGIGVQLPDELHRYIHDPAQPVHERAQALAEHLTQDKAHSSRWRSGFGQHWTSEPRVAEDFADDMAKHETVSHEGEGAPWGRAEGEIDHEGLQDHLMEHHGLKEHQLADHLPTEMKWHEHYHSDQPHIPGQLTLPGLEHGKMKKVFPEGHTHDFVDEGEPHPKPGTGIILTTGRPAREDIDDEASQGEGGMIYNYWHHGEKEVPLRKGAQVPIKSIQWRQVDPDREDLPDEYTKHDFTDEKHPPEHCAAKTATVLNTQVERLNKGDQVRTPTGQVVEVTGKPRPHETDSGKVYIDTDQGTTLVSRGTDFQVVPRNSQQQELPDTGNFAGGNSADLPGAGRTPGGPGTPHTPGSNSAVSHAACPNCGNTGTLSLKGSQFVCSVCGFQIAAGGSPGGLTFTNWPSGVMPPRKKPGEVPKAHVWASRNATLRDEGNVIARRARQVLDKEDM